MKYILLLSIILFPVLVSAQIVTTIAGNGTLGYSGDGGPASSAEFFPGAVLLDGAGNYYISDGNSHVIRKVSVAGIITTIAGIGSSGFSGDGGPATAAAFNTPEGMVFDNSGNLIVNDFGNNRVRKISTSGIVTTIAGTGVSGYSGDGGPATLAKIIDPSGIAIDNNNNLFICDGGCMGVRKISSSGIITTVAGTGAAGYTGDGGPATAATFYGLEGIALDKAGNIFVSDMENYRVRKISTSGIVTTVAGNGLCCVSHDGWPATNVSVKPWGLAVDKFNNLFITDDQIMNIYRVDPNGIITTIAGDGSTGFMGDGGPATAAEFFHPYFITLDSCGNIYIPDADNHRIRKITYAHCNYLDVQEVAAPTEISISPNPVTDELNIGHVQEKTAYRLMDKVGKVVIQGVIYKNNIPISLSGISPGIYLLELVTDDGNKIVKRIQKI